jgi:hypothetical protein
MSKPIETLKAEFTVDIALVTSLHKRATVETLAIEGSSIDNDDEAADANAHLREWLTQLDKVSAVKKETLAPLKEAEKRINALFKPLLDAGADLTGRLRNMLTVYELEKRKVQREALESAAQAASSPEPEALLEALQDVQDAAPTPLEGTSFTRVWVVKRIVRDLLPPVWLMPDEKKIAAYGKAHKGDDPPIIPGVVWEESLSSRVRR